MSYVTENPSERPKQAQNGPKTRSRQPSKDDLSYLDGTLQARRSPDATDRSNRQQQHLEHPE